MGGIDEYRALSPVRRPDRRPASGTDGGQYRGLGRAGDRSRSARVSTPDFWWVRVDGALDLVRRVGGEDTVVGKMDVPGRRAGGFPAWDEHGVYLATARASALSRLLRAPAEVLRERFSAWFPLGGHLVAGLHETARSIESTVRQREFLVTLGKLAAGGARSEINNPGGGRDPGGGRPGGRMPDAAVQVSAGSRGRDLGPAVRHGFQLCAHRSARRGPTARSGSRSAWRPRR